MTANTVLLIGYGFIIWAIAAILMIDETKIDLRSIYEQGWNDANKCRRGKNGRFIKQAKL